MVLQQEDKWASSGSGVDESQQAEAETDRSVYDKTTTQRAGWFPVPIMDLIRYHNFKLLARTILISSLVVIDGKWLFQFADCLPLEH